jgi:protoporphyrinogen oxidase
MRVAVVGGGIGGATAALRLAQRGAGVVLYEAGPALGGLVASFEIGGEPLERYYHHVFPHERAVQALIAELGLELEWLPSTMGVYRDGRVWPFTTPGDLLRFGALSLPQRLRFGAGAQLRLRARHTPALDDRPAADWLAAACGRAGTDAVWRPLLRGKFGAAAERVPAAWMLGRFRQRAGARQAGRGEVLGYMRGGFARLFDALEARLRELGVDVRTSTPVERIEQRDGRVTAVRTAAGDDPVDAVLFAGTLPVLGRLMDTTLADGHQGLGAVCVILELERQATPVYWLNVCDDEMPFAAAVEQTNLVDPQRYGGRRVVYLARYFTQDEPLATADLDELAAEWIDAYARIAPAAGPPLAVHRFRAPYAAPLVTLGYARTIPPILAPEPRGLALATTAQIYPDDRGMDNGVQLAERAVDALLRQS